MERNNKFPLFPCILFGSMLAIYFACFVILLNNEKIKNQTALSVRIEKTSSLLNNAAYELGSIQQELEQRIDLVDKLKEQAEIAESIIDLTEEQVAAIRYTLNNELNKASAKDFWLSFINNIVFMFLGFALSFWGPKLFKRLNRKKNIKIRKI